jgi:hypothetical protein
MHFPGFLEMHISELLAPYLDRLLMTPTIVVCLKGLFRHLDLRPGLACFYVSPFGLTQFRYHYPGSSARLQTAPTRFKP